MPNKTRIPPSPIQSDPRLDQNFSYRRCRKWSRNFAGIVPSFLLSPLTETRLRFPSFQRIVGKYTLEDAYTERWQRSFHVAGPHESKARKNNFPVDLYFRRA